MNYIRKYFFNHLCMLDKLMSAAACSNVTQAKLRSLIIWCFIRVYNFEIPIYYDSNEKRMRQKSSDWWANVFIGLILDKVPLSHVLV